MNLNLLDVVIYENIKKEKTAQHEDNRLFLTVPEYSTYHTGKKEDNKQSESKRVITIDLF